ncbi:ABC transporter permease subunit, partial [Streptococcus sobrinus]
MIAVIATIVASTLSYATPLIFTSIGGTFSERGGIVNVGLEGIMVMGAFSGVVFNLSFADQFGKATPWLGCLVAGLVGLVYSCLHALATINFRADHVVSGTVLNLIAPSLAVFLCRFLYNGNGQTPTIKVNFSTSSVPLLKDIPILGRIFFTNIPILAYVAIIFSFLAYFIIFKTRFGLRLR